MGFVKLSFVGILMTCVHFMKMSLNTASVIEYLIVSYSILFLFNKCPGIMLK